MRSNTGPLCPRPLVMPHCYCHTPRFCSSLAQNVFCSSSPSTPKTLKTKPSPAASSAPDAKPSPPCRLYDPRRQAVHLSPIIPESYCHKRGIHFRFLPHYPPSAPTSGLLQEFRYLLPSDIRQRSLNISLEDAGSCVREAQTTADLSARERAEKDHAWTTAELRPQQEDITSVIPDAGRELTDLYDAV